MNDYEWLILDIADTDSTADQCANCEHNPKLTGKICNSECMEIHEGRPLEETNPQLFEHKTKTVEVTAYPYATQFGSIQVPEELEDGDELHDYIEEHWNDIKFSEPELEYCGIDFEFFD